MYRRQFLQSLHVMGASIILPASAVSGEHGSVITPTNTPVLVAPGNLVEVAASVWGVPKVGIVAIGGLGSAILMDFEGRFSYVERSIAIDTDARSLRRVKADCKIRVGGDRDLPRDHHALRHLAQSSVREIADAVAGPPCRSDDRSSPDWHPDAGSLHKRLEKHQKTATSRPVDHLRRAPRRHTG